MLLEALKDVKKVLHLILIRAILVKQSKREH